MKRKSPLARPLTKTPATGVTHTWGGGLCFHSTWTTIGKLLWLVYWWQCRQIQSWQPILLHSNWTALLWTRTRIWRGCGKCPGCHGMAQLSARMTSAWHLSINICMHLCIYVSQSNSDSIIGPQQSWWMTASHSVSSWIPTWSTTLVDLL